MSLALRTGGSLVAWGGGYRGQASVPPTVWNLVAVAAGFGEAVVYATTNLLSGVVGLHQSAGDWGV